MRKPLAWFLTVLCFLNLVAPDAAFARAAATPSAEQSLKAKWSQAKNLMRQGAYDQARARFEEILAATPGDPWAELYRSLCELRLETVQTFPQLSREHYQQLQSQLKNETRTQHRTAAMNKSVQRRIRREQAAWDAKLAREQRQAIHEAKRLAKSTQAERKVQAHEAKRLVLVERTMQREREEQAALKQAQQSAPGATETPTPVLTTPEAAEQAQTPPRTSGTEGAEAPQLTGASTEPLPRSSVELERVVVATTPGAPPTSPSLVGRQRPPEGGVQINAKQMNVSPDRKLATAEGDVEIIYKNAVMTCDRLTLFTDTHDVYAEGHVRLEEGTQVFRGEMVHYNFDTKKGRFLQGSVASPPWFEHGRSVEHIAEGVYEVTPGYLTSCEFDPPHFKFYGRRAIVFQDDKSARIRNATLFVEQIPFLYLPYLYVADRKTPFYLIPGKNKLWGQFALGGYRYELPSLPDGGSQKGTLKADWRRNFRWGFGVDHEIDSPMAGKGLLKIYYNQEPNHDRVAADWKKGAAHDRYRILWRHRWVPMPDTTVITDLQKYRDADFRKEFLFREEYTAEDIPESFVSSITNTPDYSLSMLVKKRLNRFQSVDDALPQVTMDVPSQQIGETQLFSESRLDFANFQRRRAHSEQDDDVIRADWFQQLKYAVSLFRPLEVTPRVGVRETFYTKDIQGSTREGQRNLFSGQFNAGTDISLKLFRLFPVVGNAFGLNLNWLRHVLTPSISYSYVHDPTVPNSQLNFAAASGATNAVTFGVENKLQTRRPNSNGKLQSVDLARLLLSVPYEFRGSGNKRGGALGDWTVDVETYPWPWMRLESDVTIPSRFAAGSRDSRLTRWNLDLVLVGGQSGATAYSVPGIQAPGLRAFEAGVQPSASLIPQGQWYVGLGHRYSQNDKTEDVLQIDWRLSEKWQIGSFHRFTWKEVVSASKRFNNLREFQYSLRRDLHDWIGELAYRVDREYGEELFFTLTLKAFPEMPIAFEESYHQPKIGSQSSPFSPIRASTL